MKVGLMLSFVSLNARLRSLELSKSVEIEGTTLNQVNKERLLYKKQSKGKRNEMRPLRNNVLIDEIKEEKKSESGLILDGTSADTETKIGFVVAIGPDVTDVKQFDKVVPDWSKGTVVEVEGRQGVMIKEDDILGILED
jgi:chaperonin GroES